MRSGKACFPLESIPSVVAPVKPGKPWDADVLSPTATIQYSTHPRKAWQGRVRWVVGRVTAVTELVSAPCELERMVARQEKVMTRICKLTTGSVAVALTLATWTTSGFAIGTAEQRAACTPDVFRLCSAEIPNVDRIVVCLKQQKPNLSKPCQAVMNSP